MTVLGAETLKNELRHRKTIERSRISNDIAEARAHGDLKENAEYHAAREQQSFNELKRLVSTAPVMAHFDTQKETKVVVDASPIGLGAIMLQASEDNKFRAVAYASRALTPTEIEKAWSFGATMVKVFPAAQMGPDYIRLLKGPFEQIKLMAVGGITPNNISDYFSAGASAVALGGSIFSARRMADKEFSLMQKEIEEFMFAVNKVYSNMVESAVAK